MKSRPKMDEQQTQFLRCMREEVMSLDDVMRRCNVTGQLLSEWLDSKTFARHLHKAVRNVQRWRALELELAAKCGTHKMSTLIYSRDDNLARLSSLNVVGKANENAAARRREAKAQKSTREKRIEEQPELPPDLSPERARELLAKLEHAKKFGKNDRSVGVPPARESEAR